MALRFFLRKPLVRKVNDSGFTIVELLVVIVVIAILAAITIVSYNGITKGASEATLKADLQNGSKQISIVRINDGSYPSSLPSEVTGSGGNTFEYTSDGSTFCLTGYSSTPSVPLYHVSDKGVITQGACSGHTGAAINYMQIVTNANCPSSRTLAIDARDNRTYWVQKLADGKCWMLTNLAYAGGGTNTYSDVKTLTDGTGGSITYSARYYVPTNANITTNPATPSTSTDGTGQYGYFYNWCAAMGVQVGTSACMNATTPAPNTNISICPAGWRLPAGGGGDFTAINSAINGGSTTSDAGLIASPWLLQRSGYWRSGFVNQGVNGSYWSSTQNSANYGHSLYFTSSNVSPASSSYKYDGVAVRCVAS